MASFMLGFCDGARLDFFEIVLDNRDVVVVGRIATVLALREAVVLRFADFGSGSKCCRRGTSLL